MVLLGSKVSSPSRPNIRLVPKVGDLVIGIAKRLLPHDGRLGCARRWHRHSRRILFERTACPSSEAWVN